MNLTPQPILVGERVQQLDMLLHIQEFSSMIAVITGDAKMGKSAILDSAVTQLSIHHQIIHFSACDIRLESEILSYISSQLGVDGNWQAVDASLSEIQSQSETVILIIDDAHLLESEALKFVALKALNASSWHLVIAGDESVLDRLAEVESDAHQKNAIHHVALSSITEEESIECALTFFARRGVDQSILSRQKITYLWRLSEGNPGKLLDLLENELDAKVKKDSKFPLGHVAAICLIAIALSVSYLYQNDEANTLAESVIESKDDEVALNSDLQAIIERQSLLVESDQLETKPVVKKPIENQDSTDSSVVTQDRLPLSLVEGTEKLTVSQVATEMVTEKAVVPEEPKLNAHPLLKASPDGFALQLLGVSKRASAEKVLNEFTGALGSEFLSVYETTYKGKPWFVVVYGPLGDKKSANERATAISKVLKNKPWVRPMAKIQDDIRNISP